MIRHTDNDVYKIGRTSWKKSVLCVVLVAVAVAAVSVVLALHRCYGFTDKSTYVERTTRLAPINVLPEGSKPPRFMGQYGVKGFIAWVGRNMEYPKGHETTPARVVVEFVVQKDGTLGQLRIVSAPSDPVFSKAVLNMLRRCPRWTPACLADGSPTAVKYTLPVAFSPVRTE